MPQPSPSFRAAFRPLLRGARKRRQRRRGGFAGAVDEAAEVLAAAGRLIEIEAGGPLTQAARGLPNPARHVVVSVDRSPVGTYSTCASRVSSRSKTSAAEGASSSVCSSRCTWEPFEL